MVEEPVVPVMISQLVSKFKELVKKVTYDKSEIDSKLNGKASNTLVSSSANGLMSSVDKTKLDGIDEEANKIVVDSAMSSSSVNPVQNKVVHQELANKSDIDHTHIIDDVSNLQSTLDNKAPSSHVHPRLVPTSIPENADLNDYTIQGSFKCGMNVTAATLTNCPTNKAFHLEVYAHAGVRQVLYTYMDEDNWAYERNWSGSGGNGNRWDEWRRIPTDLDIASLNSTKANSNHTHNDYSATVTVPCEYGTVRKFRKNGWVMVIWENIDITSLPAGTWVSLADIGWSNQAGNNYTGNFQTQDPNSNRFRVTVEGELRAWKQKESNNQGYYGYIVYPTAD